VWSVVDRFSDPELRDELKPRVAKGTVRFCLGYTEPDGGSDIAAAKVRAVRDGDEWVLNGPKMFTTGAHNCQYTFLITRTDLALPKHRGLTLFLVPLDEEHGVGAADDGLADLSIGRNFLRPLEAALDATIQCAKSTTRPDGTRPIDDPSVLARLGRIAMELEAGICTPGPMGRVKGSLALVEGAAELVDILGPEGVVQIGGQGAVADGAADFAHRWAQGTATYGGTVEVFQTIIAQHVLGLPRPSYPGSKTLIQRSSTATRS
jgi:alkylation response protein AidB-like acyl-CoA dehydrogenase